MMSSVIVEAFLLGISTGVYCFSQCGIVLAPYIFSEENTKIKDNSIAVFKFLLGRFFAYLLVGGLIGFLGQTVNNGFLSVPENISGKIVGFSYIVLSLLLILNATSHLKKNSNYCRKYNRYKTYLHLPVILGLITGINVCPPFLLAATKVFEIGNAAAGILFFLVFYIGTSLFLLPFSFSGVFKKIKGIKTIAQFTSVIVGIYLGITGALYIFI